MFNEKRRYPVNTKTKNQLNQEQMTILKPSHRTNDRDNLNEPVAEGWINLKFQLSRKTIAMMLGALSTFGSGFAAGSIYANPPVRNLEVSPPTERCNRGETGETLCPDRDRGNYDTGDRQR
jgi:hypothetical protein